MPKKPKIDKRLDKLFKDIQPEQSLSESKRSSKVQEEAPFHPADSSSASSQRLKPVQQKSEAVVSPKPIKRDQAITASTTYLNNSALMRKASQPQFSQPVNEFFYFLLRRLEPFVRSFPCRITGHNALRAVMNRCPPGHDASRNRRRL